MRHRVLAAALLAACSPAPRVHAPEPMPAAAREGLGQELALKATERLKAEDWFGALELLRRATQASPALERLEPGERRNRLEGLLGDLDLSSDSRRAALSRENGLAGGAAFQAILAFVEGRDVEAVLAASAAVGEDPQAQAIRDLLASICRRTGLVAPKEQFLPRAALVQYKLHLAEKAYFDKRYGEAARESQEAAWLDATSVLAWTRLGSARWASGEFEKAREAFEKVLFLDPNNAEVRGFMESRGLLGRGRPAAPGPATDDRKQTTVRPGEPFRVEIKSQ